MRVIGIVALAIPVTGNWLHEKLLTAVAQHYGFSSSEEHYASAAAFGQFTASNKQIFTDNFGLSSEQFHESANKFALVNGLESMTVLINEADPTLLDSVKTSASPTRAQIRHVVELIESKIQDEHGIFSNSVSLPMYTLAVGVYHFGQSTTQLEYIMEGGNANVQFSAAIISNDLSGTVLGSTKVTGSDSVSMTLSIVSDSTSGVVETISASVDFGGSAFVQLHIDESAAVNFGLKAAVGKSLFVTTTDGTDIIVDDPFTIAVDNQSNALVVFDVTGRPIGQIQSITVINETTPFLIAKGTLVILSGPLQTQWTVSTLNGTLALSESAKFVVGQAPSSQTLRADILSGITGMTTHLSFFGTIIVGGEITTSLIGSIRPNSLTVTGAFGDVQVSGSETTIKLAQLIATSQKGVTFFQTDSSGEENQSSIFQFTPNAFTYGSNFLKPNSNILITIFIGSSGNPVSLDGVTSCDINDDPGRCVELVSDTPIEFFSCPWRPLSGYSKPTSCQTSPISPGTVYSCYIGIDNKLYKCENSGEIVSEVVVCASDALTNFDCNSNSGNPYYCLYKDASRVTDFASDTSYRTCSQLQSASRIEFFDCSLSPIADGTVDSICDTSDAAGYHYECYQGVDNRLYGCVESVKLTFEIVQCNDNPTGLQSCSSPPNPSDDFFYCPKPITPVNSNFGRCRRVSQSFPTRYYSCIRKPKFAEPLGSPCSDSIPAYDTDIYDCFLGHITTWYYNNAVGCAEILQTVVQCSVDPSTVTDCQFGNNSYYCFQHSVTLAYDTCVEITQPTRIKYYGCVSKPTYGSLIDGSGCTTSETTSGLDHRCFVSADQNPKFYGCT